MRSYTLSLALFFQLSIVFAQDLTTVFSDDTCRVRIGRRAPESVLLKLIPTTSSMAYDEYVWSQDVRLALLYGAGPRPRVQEPSAADFSRLLRDYLDLNPAVEISRVIRTKRGVVKQTIKPTGTTTQVVAGEDPLDLRTELAGSRLLRLADGLAFVFSPKLPSCGECLRLGDSLTQRLGLRHLSLEVRADHWFVSDFFPVRFAFDGLSPDAVFDLYGRGGVPSAYTYYRQPWVQCWITQPGRGCTRYGVLERTSSK